jgi:assimilatory nitrate reductase catalytic subunit
LCSKGAALGETLGMAGRLLEPEIGGVPVSWDVALDAVAGGFRAAIDQHGPDAVAFYVSGQLLTEDYYVANKLMKGFIGSGNIDTNSRLCMASTVAGHRRAFGEDLVPGSYDDLDQCDLAVLVGSNAAWCHPILYQRLHRARSERGVGLVVIDPRRTASCDGADLHLAIKPGSDVLLFNGLLAELARRGLIALEWLAAHTSGFSAALGTALAEADRVDRVAAGCGVPVEQVARFYELFARTRRVVTVFSQGVNQSSHGTDKVNAILNVHLPTGRIGRPGMGPFSVTGQPNAMGGREVGGLANQLAAHMAFDPAAVDRLRRFWKSPRVAERPGLKAVELFEAVGQGRIKALWIMGTNPAVSLPGSGQVRAALAACPLVVVSDCVRDTDTTGFAHVRLPAAGWGEKDGTVTNSDRRISRQRASLPLPGAARPDWQIIAEVAARLGWGAAFGWAGPAAIFREHAALSHFENRGQRRFDLGPLAGLSDEDYDDLTPVQWPVGPGLQGTARLFADGHFAHADGRARLVPVSWRPPAAAADQRYPLVLNTGRLRDQWHTMTRTGGVPRLVAHCNEPFIAVNPDDAALDGLTDGGFARVTSAVGAALLRVRVTPDQPRGRAFAPIHWSEHFAAAGGVGPLVAPVTDAVSGQPELKHTPVRLTPWRPGWHGFLVSRTPLTPAADYWVRTAAEGCWVYVLAGAALPVDLEAWAGALVGTAAGRLEVHDAGRASHRWAGLEGGRLAACLFVGPDRLAGPSPWLVERFALATVVEADRPRLLCERPDAAGAEAGRLVCSCLDVSEATIVTAIARQGLTSADAVGQATRAGTGCGSCRSEISALIAKRAA